MRLEIYILTKSINIGPNNVVINIFFSFVACKYVKRNNKTQCYIVKETGYILCRLV